MLQRLSILPFFLVILISMSFGQDGKLTGKVFDKDGQPLAFTTVVVYEGDLTRHGTQTGEDGSFSINPIAAGVYRVEARYLGSTKALENVSVIAGQTRNITINFKEDVTTTLDEVEIFGNPVFEKDPAVTTTLTGKEIQNLGTRNVQTVAALTAGVYQSDEGGNLSIRGARDNATVYYIDGVKIRGQTTLPQASIAQFQVITGGTPAEFGDFTGGVVSITTASPAAKLGGSVELVTSEYLDPYGRNLVAASLTGPLITKTRFLEGTETQFKSSILSFFINGEFDYRQDGDPAALGIFKLKDDVLADLEANPVVISDDGLSFRSRANFITSDDFESIDAKINNRGLRARGLARLDFQPADNVLIKMGGTYEYIDNDNWAIGSSLFAPDHQDQFIGQNYRGWLRFQQTFAGNQNSVVKNLFYSVQADYSLYQRRFQNKVHQDRLFDYGYVGEFNFDRIPAYQYIDDPLSTVSSSPYWQSVGFANNNLTFDAANTKNPLIANYNTQIFDYVEQNGVPNLFSFLFTFDPTVNTLTSLNDLAFRQGILNGQGPRQIYSLFSGIGANEGVYQKFDFEQYRLMGQATAEIQGHNIKAGFEFEQRVERRFAVVARSLWSWARQYANFHLTLEDDPNNFIYGTNAAGEFNDSVEVPLRYNADDQRVFDKNLREKLSLPVDGTDFVNIDALSPDFFSLDMFSADELLADGLGPMTYYGFDYTGQKTQRVDPGEFFTNEDLRPQNAFAPTYVSVFLQDKFEFEDINFNIGLRVDRFDANQPVLKDNFSLYPTYSAGEVASGELGIPQFTLPNGIGSDFVPYVNDPTNFSEIIGYRSGETWYDENGTPISSAEIARRSGGKPNPAVRNDEVSIESFEDYTPQTTFMPRISFSFPISDVALFFAHYDVLAQRPGQLLSTQSSLLAGQISNYAFLENSPTTTVINPNLKPEITVDYEAGFKQKLTNTMALTISAFYREQRNMINFRRFTNAFPFSYDSYDNLDFGTVKGLSLSYDMRRTGNVSLRASYTLQYADATGSSFNSARAVVNFLEGVGVLRVPLPISNDQRHRLTGAIDYRFLGNKMGPGLNFGSKTVHPLKNFGANLSFTLGSGTPFTKNAVPVPSVVSGVNIVNQIQGTPNGARRPWTFRTDLRVDKGFTIRGKSDIDGTPKKGFDVNVYLLLLNALDTRNVISVYRYTGLPDDDGYLASDTGNQAVVTQISPQSFVDLYTARLANPNNYSIPRRIRLGLLFNF